MCVSSISAEYLIRCLMFQGQGLGKNGQGFAAPLLVNLRPQGRGLGSARSDEGGGIKSKKIGKKKRGGERSRRKKFKAAARSRKESNKDEASRAEHPGVFGLLNQSTKDNTVLDTGLGSGQSAKHRHKHAKPAPADRQALMSQEHEVTLLGP